MRKKLLFTICAFCITITPDMVFAAKCNYSPQYVSCYNTSGKVTLGENCSQTAHICFDDTDYSYCRSCIRGFVLQDREDTHSSGCTIEYTTCVSSGGGQEIACKGCLDALDGPTYTDWVSAPYYAFSSSTVTVPGYQVRTKTTCDESTSWECKNTTEVRCAGGYWGKNPTQTRETGYVGEIYVSTYKYDGCTECKNATVQGDPDAEKVSYIKNSTAGKNESETSCYIDLGASSANLVDESGFYTATRVDNVTTCPYRGN